MGTCEYCYKTVQGGQSFDHWICMDCKMKTKAEDQKKNGEETTR
ncbi:hypothetical protein [Ammoniphilus oxalaticus]|nr:hypothetical protein [Ammoniphilus oxalaticus]